METVNHNIQCSVGSCAHHAGQKNYCTLNSIQVGCCESNPKCCEGTECASFHSSNKACGC